MAPESEKMEDRERSEDEKVSLNRGKGYRNGSIELWVWAAMVDYVDTVW